MDENELRLEELETHWVDSSICKIKLINESCDFHYIMTGRFISACKNENCSKKHDCHIVNRAIKEHIKTKETFCINAKIGPFMF